MLRAASNAQLRPAVRNLHKTTKAVDAMPGLGTTPPGGKMPMISDTGKFLLGAAAVSTAGYFGYGYLRGQQLRQYRRDISAHKGPIPETKEAIDSAMNKSIVPPAITIKEPPADKAGEAEHQIDEDLPTLLETGEDW
ncbi:unnamed protein product, partial [Mesorhabditis spiculigera]